MTPERWQQVKALLAEAMESEPAQRAAFLDRIGASDASLRDEVERLLAAGEEAGAEYLDHDPAAALAEEAFSANAWAGRRVGAYQTVERIGGGGMGDVYRAFRADDQYQKQVAVKLLRIGLNSGSFARRFRNERQVLASLDHPNIARLLDGGATEEGVPYFVMELIDGEPIDLYCARRRLTVSERLGVFLEVCSAVAYAHQRLIVHRDLKPANLLVTPDAGPKLLDFGIAKILAPADLPVSLATTVAAFRPLTPEYASPEQIKGEAITTSSDIYSLGVVLYELLTGFRPYDLSALTTLEAASVVCESEPEAPSQSVARRTRTSVTGGDGKPVSPATPKRLRGDLDNIVLLALRKEPSRRYSSVEQFAADIRRHLEGLPVLARRDTFAYRAGKFVRRHRAGVAAAAVVILSLAAGLGIALREAHLARQQAEVARAQKGRAEQRFQDVRTLANSLLFEVYDSIQSLPGATPARKLIVDRASQYLDSLAKESAGDPSLQSELASAYQRLAQVQGDPNQGNLGDFSAMVATMGKAAALWEAAAQANPAGVTYQLNAAFGHRLVAVLAIQESVARREIDRAMQITARLLSADRANSKVLSERSIEYGVLAQIQESAGDFPGALASLENAAPLRRALVQANYPRARGGLAILQVQIGEKLAELGQRSQALDSLRAGIAAFEDIARNPTEGRAQRDLAVAWVRRAAVLSMDADFGGALAAYRRALAIIQPLAQADPRNFRLHLDLAEYSVSASSVLIKQHRLAEATPLLDQGIAFLEHPTGTADLEIPESLAAAYTWKGQALAAAHNQAAALEHYRKAIAVLEREVAGNADAGARCQLAAAYVQLGSALAAAGQIADARAAHLKAASMLEPLLRDRPGDVPARYVFADVCFFLSHSTAANGSEAKSWQQRGLDAWRAIPNPAPFSPLGFRSHPPS